MIRTQNSPANLQGLHEKRFGSCVRTLRRVNIREVPHRKQSFGVLGAEYAPPDLYRFAKERLGLRIPALLVIC
jgi:hypothetical protein